MKNEEVGGIRLILYPSAFSFQRCPSLMVIELKKPGVPGLASAFIQFQRDDLLSRRDKRENCDTL
jgi:hypothetical protein